ncbi:hypothetical protein MRX96_040798 [Rhipicephalus microplus]
MFSSAVAEQKLRETWIQRINRAGRGGRFSKFTPTTGHRVCGAHFEGGKKTYMNRVPTIFPLRPQKVERRRPLIRTQIVRNALASAEAVRVSDGHCMPSTSSGALDAYQAGNRTFSPMANAELRRCVTHDHNYWKKSRDIASQTDEMLDTRALSKGTLGVPYNFPTGQPQGALLAKNMWLAASMQ